MFTVDLAYDLRETTIKVNSACPGYTATDLNNHSGHQTLEEGAVAIVRLAQLPDGGPTGASSIKTVLTPGRRSPVEDDPKKGRPHLERDGPPSFCPATSILSTDQQRFKIQLSLTGAIHSLKAIVGDPEITARHYSVWASHCRETRSSTRAVLS